MAYEFNTEKLSKLPAQFYERLIKDVSATTWVRILTSNPILKREVLEGFSFQPGKFARVLVQPLIVGRLRRRLQSDRDFLGKILAEWREEQPTVVSYLEMLDRDFLITNWKQVRDLLGPERFCIGLSVLEFFHDDRFANLIDRTDFWSLQPDEDVFALLVPTLSAWGFFIDHHPDLAKRFLASEKGADYVFELDEEEQAKQKAKPEQEMHEPFRKVEKKLEKTQAELLRSGEQISHLKSENEELRKKLKEWESEFDRKLNDSVANRRRQWYERYRQIDLKAAADEAGRLESLLQRTKRALELQRKADEEFGVVSDIRAKLLEIDLALEKIEQVYADSLVVHKEVEKVKAALLDEKKRFLQIPGIRKILGPAERGQAADLMAQIPLLDPIPANLPKVNELEAILERLAHTGLFRDTVHLREAVRHKKRQILEGLYSHFTPAEAAGGKHRPFRDLEDFIQSGQSRRYDLFVDGYNVLLKVHGDSEVLKKSFTQMREQFIEAVVRKGSHFGRVFLVFDGVENSRDLRGNTEIIYTDKTRMSADSAIIDRISARKDRNILLVTEDEEIISSVENRIFALISPIDFYMFAFE